MRDYDRLLPKERRELAALKLELVGKRLVSKDVLTESSEETAARQINARADALSSKIVCEVCGGEEPCDRETR